MWSKIFGIWMLLLSVSTWTCSDGPSEPISDVDLVTGWSDLVLYITKHTPSNSPTYASRAIGYIGLTMYESVVPGFPNYNSMEGQLNGLQGLPEPDENTEYDWPIALNAACREIIKSVYNQTSEENKYRIDSTYQHYLASLSGNHQDELIRRSDTFGTEVARAVFEWSKSDGGHRGYLKNFDKEIVHPDFPGSWKPPLYAQSFSHHPLHPHWGENRTFLKENSNLTLPEFIPYDTTPGSAYYEQFKAVYDQDLALTQKEKEIAIWWGDDPDDTFTPPGHSFYITNKLVKDQQPSLIDATMTYARVGMAVADAFTNCWKWKYHFFSERPNTFIPQFIDQTWESFWPDPPFPAFPSGHAINGAACAQVLTDLYGPAFTFVDSSHVGRKRDEVRDVDFVERPFDSIWHVALEIANSRFYGGIHTPQDNQVGLAKGVEIAQNVASLNWKR